MSIKSNNVKYINAVNTNRFMCAWAWSSAYALCAALGKSFNGEFPGTHGGDEDVQIGIPMDEDIPEEELGADDTEVWHLYVIMQGFESHGDIASIRSTVEKFCHTYFPPGLEVADFSLSMETSYSSNEYQIEVEIIFSDETASLKDLKDRYELYQTIMTSL